MSDEAEFDSAAAYISTAAASVNDSVKLEIYGLFKYVTCGPPKSPRPGIFSPTARAKHDAWAHSSTQPIAEAKARYIELARDLGWKGDSHGRGVRVSTMEGEAESLVEFERRLYTADVHSRDENGSTPLHVAADRGLLVAVQRLLSHGADPTLKDNDGQTPLDIAILLQREDITQVLIGATRSSPP